MIVQVMRGIENGIIILNSLLELGSLFGSVFSLAGPNGLASYGSEHIGLVYMCWMNLEKSAQKDIGYIDLISVDKALREIEVASFIKDVDAIVYTEAVSHNPCSVLSAMLSSGWATE